MNRKRKITKFEKNFTEQIFSGIQSPAVYLVDFETRRIVMQYINNSKTVSERIYELTAISNNENTIELQNIANKMGHMIGKMHCHSIIHGDLTTSNILVRFENETTWELFIIDFGLSYSKSSDEDKAVDLYVLERALTSKHNEVIWFFEEFLKSYFEFDVSCTRVKKKFQEVRSRGRKRTMIG